jgi:hypothetical protein
MIQQSRFNMNQQIQQSITMSTPLMMNNMMSIANNAMNDSIERANENLKNAMISSPSSLPLNSPPPKPLFTNLNTNSTKKSLKDDSSRLISSISVLHNSEESKDNEIKKLVERVEYLEKENKCFKEILNSLKNMMEEKAYEALLKLLQELGL